MFYTESVASIIYKMKMLFAMKLIMTLKTFARHLVFERENLQLLNQSELNNIVTLLCTELLMPCMLCASKYFIEFYIVYACKYLSTNKCIIIIK